jgi:hypothetical protein
VEELEELAEEARRVGEVNMTGVILSVGTFVSNLHPDDPPNLFIPIHYKSDHLGIR